jgi:hypothetical protein
MTHMTKEFSLVLLGAGLLTAGGFLYPEENLERHAQDAAARQVGGNRASRSHVHFYPIFLGRTGTVPGRVAASPTISRGGFGSTGHFATGGS